MPASAAFLNAAAAGGVATITHLALVDDTGTELTGGTYARVATTWSADGDGVQRPNADKTFNIPAGATVAGWRGKSASTAGTDFGGDDLREETYTGAGTYVLDAETTGYVLA